MSSGCTLFQREVALYSKNLWPLAVRKNGILNISQFLVVLVETADLFTNFDVLVSGAFNSQHDSVKPLFHSSLLDWLTRHLGLACSRNEGYLSFKLLLYPNSDSTSQLTRLTTIGDISLNPGPERCSVCSNSVARNHLSHPATPTNFGGASSAAKSRQGSLKGLNHSKTSTEFPPLTLSSSVSIGHKSISSPLNSM